MAAGLIDRATADDMVSLATDVAATPMQVGAMLLIEAGPELDVLVDALESDLAALTGPGDIRPATSPALVATPQPSVDPSLAQPGAS